MGASASSKVIARSLMQARTYCSGISGVESVNSATPSPAPAAYFALAIIACAELSRHSALSSRGVLTMCMASWASRKARWAYCWASCANEEAGWLAPTCPSSLSASSRRGVAQSMMALVVVEATAPDHQRFLNLVVFDFLIAIQEVPVIAPVQDDVYILQQGFDIHEVSLSVTRFRGSAARRRRGATSVGRRPHPGDCATDGGCLGARRPNAGWAQCAAASGAP